MHHVGFIRINIGLLWANDEANLVRGSLFESYQATVEVDDEAIASKLSLIVTTEEALVNVPEALPIHLSLIIVIEEASDCDEGFICISA